MSDEAGAIAMSAHARVRAGLRTQRNWLELLRFGVVGGSGYVLNLAVFAVAVHGFGAGATTAATAAFLVAVTNNFVLNRRWTFRAHQGQAHHQAARFLAVSVAGFAVNLSALAVLVGPGGLAEVPAQAISIALATPLTFLGNKLWTFAS